MATNNAINISPTFSVANGGTGATSFTAHTILLGNTTSAVQVTNAGTNGQVLLGSSSGAPAFASLTSSASTITYTTGANALDLGVTNWVDKTSWTPVLKFGGGTMGITYTTQVGTYTRINNLVLFVANIVLSSKGSSTGTAVITGLPLTSISSNFQGSMYFNSLTFTNQVEAQIDASSTQISLWNSASGSAAVVLTDTAFSNTTTLRITGIYMV